MTSFSPEEMQQYHKEFDKSMHMFQEALSGYHKSTIDKQKEMFKDVMNKTMGVMDELSNTVLDKEGQDMEQKLSGDYQQFAKEGNAQGFDKVQDELANLRRIYSSEHRGE